MPDQTLPKRRGRPPGSRNKASRPILLKPSQPDPFELVGVMGPAPLRVTLMTKGRAFGDPVAEEEIDWPSEWRLPQAGEAIFLSERFGGFVEYLSFWPNDRKIIIRLR